MYSKLKTLFPYVLVRGSAEICIIFSLKTLPRLTPKAMGTIFKTERGDLSAIERPIVLQADKPEESLALGLLFPHPRGAEAEGRLHVQRVCFLNRVSLITGPAVRAPVLVGCLVSRSL